MFTLNANSQPVVTSSCVSTCTPAVNSVTCTQVDLGNKQGPDCFNGYFGDWAAYNVVNCMKGQVCQRETIITEYSATLTKGSCAWKCTPSLTTYCCSEDLCNGYQANDSNY